VAMTDTQEISLKVSRWLDSNKPVRLELERVILGAVLMESTALVKIIDVLVPANFSENNIKYWTTIKRMYNSKPIDFKTFTHEHVKNYPKSDIKKTIDDMINAVSCINSSCNIMTHAYMLLEHGIVARFLELYTANTHNKKVAAFAEDVLQILLDSNDKLQELDDMVAWLENVLPEEDFTLELKRQQQSISRYADHIKKQEAIRVNISNLLALSDQKTSGVIDALTSVLISLINNPDISQQFTDQVYHLKSLAKA
jgi:replicative DNA helicase